MGFSLENSAYSLVRIGFDPTLHIRFMKAARLCVDVGGESS